MVKTKRTRRGKRAALFRAFVAGRPSVDRGEAYRACGSLGLSATQTRLAALDNGYVPVDDDGGAALFVYSGTGRPPGGPAE